MGSKIKASPRHAKTSIAQSLLRRLRTLWRAYNCWELLLFVIGAMSFVGVMVILFIPIGKGPP